MAIKTKVPNAAAWRMARTDGSVVTITGKDLLEAIKKNGFEHLRGQWFAGNDGKVTGACIIGQAAINLGADSDYVQNRVDKVFTIGARSLPDGIKEEFLEKPNGRFIYGDDKNHEFTFGFAAVMIAMNDKMVDDISYAYSWNQLVRYAEKFLTPYLDINVKLEASKFFGGYIIG